MAHNMAISKNFGYDQVLGDGCWILEGKVNLNGIKPIILQYVFQYDFKPIPNIERTQ